MFKYLDYLDKKGKYKIVDNYIKKISSRDPLEILGLTTDFTQEELKSAYRNLVKKFHPDVNKDDPNSSKNFIEVDEAYKKIQENPNKYKSKNPIHYFLDLFKSPEFIEFYSSDALYNYYRFQTGRIRKKSDKEAARVAISWFRNKLSESIQNVYLLYPDTYWSISDQNIINIFSRAKWNKQDISVPIQTFKEYFDENNTGYFQKL